MKLCLMTLRYALGFAALCFAQWAANQTATSLIDAECRALVSRSCLVGMGLLIAGALWSALRAPRGQVATFAALGLLVYLFLIDSCLDPYQYASGASTDRQVMWLVVSLLPWYVGGIVFASRHRWPEALGCWCLLYSSLSVLLYNLGHTSSWISYFKAFRA